MPWDINLVRPADSVQAMARQVLPHAAAMLHDVANHARRGFLPGPPYEPILGPLTRLPVAWLLLQPSRTAARHQQPAAELAVPVQINLTLPDYMVPSDAFDRGMRIEWRPADRFRMYFGRRQFGTRSGELPCWARQDALVCPSLYL